MTVAPQQAIGRAVLARTACELLAENGPLPIREVFGAVEAALRLTEEQLATSPRKDHRRFELDLAFTSVNETRAGWLLKEKGLWSVTDAGRAALEKWKSAEEFHAEAQRLYRESVKARPPRGAAGPIDRNSAENAADLVEAFYPDEAERQACLTRMAATIRLVSDLPPEIWSITVKRELIRLNVGRLAAVSLRPGALDMLLDLRRVSGELRAQAVEAGGTFDTGLVSAPDLGWIAMPASALPVLGDLLAEAHAAGVKHSAEQVKRCPYLAAHSPGMVDYLNMELGEDIAGPSPTSGKAFREQQTLTEALQAYDRGAAGLRLEDAEALRAAMVAEFPRESWPTMPLERYALGGGPDTYCYWIEYKTGALGSIKGGSARKHIIYKKVAGPGWFFDAAYKDENEAWEAVRAGFVEAFDLIGKGDFRAVDTIPTLRSGAVLRAKTAFVYFPDRFLPIYSVPHISHFVQLLGSSLPELETVAANRYLFDLVYGRSEFEGWSPLEIVDFLYSWSHPRQNRRIVKIAPGEKARFWDDCLAGGYICVGWDEMGDLTRFATKQEYKAAFVEKFGNPARANQGPAAQKAEELWTLMDLEPGDLVIANRGTSQILGVGTVTDEGYSWREDRAEYRHTVGVDWDESVARVIPPVARWAVTTVSPVSPALYQQLMGGETEAEPVDGTLSEIAEAIERKGQVIIYGPPGTGKTYNARRFTVWWLRLKDGASDATAPLSDPDVFTSLEDELAKSGQLQRVTFHPSYTYEDFVEGFKPVKGDGSGLRLELQDGAFKRLCRAAQDDPSRPYLLLVDEINRGNIPKIFGELITLLEDDKRDVPVLLPQSSEWFSVPKNVYLLGTMNTADRSIRLLDTALRRRFAFKELMPDVALLANSLVGPLALDGFLRELNSRIARNAGREKQIGHAYLMSGTRAVSTVEEFAARFRQDILPLLQEYAYDNYAVLADYLGPGLVDVENLEMRAEVVEDAEALVAALHDSFDEAGPGATVS